LGTNALFRPHLKSNTEIHAGFKYYAVIADATGHTALGYPLKRIGEGPQLQWEGNSQLVLDGQGFDPVAHPPVAIP
jgi:hypothetical protein